MTETVKGSEWEREGEGMRVCMDVCERERGTGAEGEGEKG